jgi:hypothetical protein
MLQKSAGFAAIALAAAMLVVPDATFARGGGIGGFHGGIRAPFFSPRAVIRRAPFMARTGAHPLFRAPSTLPPAVAVRLPVHTHVAAPFSHLVRRHHRGFINGWIYPLTFGDDFGYIGTPYDPGETIPVYGPAPAMDPAADPPAPRPVPRLSSAREEGQDACRSERVTVPAGEGEREITVVRC